MKTEGHSRFARAVFALAAALVRAVPLSAQQPSPTAGAAVGATVRLSLDDALRLAEAQSPNIEVARSNVVRANGQRYQVRSQFFPQLNATAGYNKTLQSQFSSFSASPAPVDTTPKLQALCTPNIPANATPDQRLAALAQSSSCQSSTSALGFDLSNTSFGAKNQWTVGLNFSQNVYTGGRITAQADAANAQLSSANIEVSAQRAQSALDVTSAYYDAALADQLVAIADSSVAQTEVVLAQTRVARQVGNAAEYDLLRAQVTRDNQLPAAIQARSNREIAYLRLKQQLNMPLDNVVQLTTQIETPQGGGPNLPSIASTAVDTSVLGRAPVRELDEAVRASEAQIKVARAERIPTLAIVSAFQRLYFPQQLFPSSNFGVNNWTVGVQTSFPILDGGRIKGDQLIAEAGLKQARAQREQTRQFAALDTRVALNQLAEAQSTWEASKGTAEQAQKTYAIDEVRFREGISTQTDLTQSRLLLEQSRANRAMAARNLAVARVRLALLHDLPIQQTGTGAVSGQNATAQQQLQQQQQSQQQTNSAARTPNGAGGTTGSIQP